MYQAKPIKQSVNIPVEFAQYVFDKRYFNFFKTYTAARMVTPGYFRQGDRHFQALCKALGLQARSVLKHLYSLYKLGWVGYDKPNRRYYLRSIAWFRRHNYFLERHSVVASPDDLPTFQELLMTAVLKLGIDRQKYFIYRTQYDHGFRRIQPWQSVKPAVIIGGTAIQGFKDMPEAIKQLPYYLGYSNTGIGKKINYSKTRACEIKHQAEKAGYVKTDPHFLLIEESVYPIPNWRKKYLKSGSPDPNKVRVRTSVSNGITWYQLVYQLHDEITPLIELKRINYFKKVKQAYNRSKSPISIPGAKNEAA